MPDPKSAKKAGYKKVKVTGGRKSTKMATPRKKGSYKNPSRKTKTVTKRTSRGY